MTTGPDDDQQTSSGKPDTADIEADIAATREDLAETVDALSAKLDVKARAHDKAEHTKEQIRDFTTDPAGRPTPLLGAAGAVAAGVVAMLLVRAWRRRH
ncbi:MAG: DUF3618 domain-containing protein [Nocardioides sp.]|nr:DUF3618 domain-containing protein [Nocardioides sp.]